MKLVALAVRPLVLRKDAPELEASPASNGVDRNVGTFDRIASDDIRDLRCNGEQRWAQLPGNPENPPATLGDVVVWQRLPLG
ncbi:hypothetical protein, partial [Stenotrophomonas maltophilia]|uniref:hypothetical protein n=1 Tax=Stenotrophomonas maltophilia TaxID=40324 RepID=UPI0013DC390A